MAKNISIQGLKRIGLEYRIALGKELLRQGQTKRSGGLIKSLRQIEMGGFQPTVRIVGNHYWRFINYGVSAGHIKKPYAYPRIEGLMNWLRRKGIGSGDKMIRGIAFAIATVHAKSGMPQRQGKRDFKRMNFVDKAIHQNRARIQAIIDTTMGKEYSQIINKLHR